MLRIVAEQKTPAPRCALPDIDQPAAIRVTPDTRLGGDLDVTDVVVVDTIPQAVALATARLGFRAGIVGTFRAPGVVRLKRWLDE